MAKSIYISDDGNNRIIDRTIPGLDYISAISNIPGYSYGGTGNLYQPRGLCNDGTYLYLINGGDNLLKLALGATAADLTYVADIGTTGSGNDQFSEARGICTFGGYLYIADAGNSRIVKRQCSDLSYVGQISTFDSGDTFFGPKSLVTDGTFVYVADPRTYPVDSRVVKVACSDLSWSSTTITDAGVAFNGIEIDGASIFVSGRGMVV